MQATLSSTLIQMQQTLPPIWEHDSPPEEAASAAQIYAVLSTIGAIQELVPTLSLQLKRSLEIVTGIKLDLHFFSHYGFLISANNQSGLLGTGVDNGCHRIYDSPHLGDWCKMQYVKHGKEFSPANLLKVNYLVLIT